MGRRARAPTTTKQYSLHNLVFILFVFRRIQNWTLVWLPYFIFWLLRKGLSCVWNFKWTISVVIKQWTRKNCFIFVSVAHVWHMTANSQFSWNYRTWKRGDFFPFLCISFFTFCQKTVSGLDSFNKYCLHDDLTNNENKLTQFTITNVGISFLWRRNFFYHCSEIKPYYVGAGVWLTFITKTWPERSFS